MPSSRRVRKTLMAISPRLATSTFENRGTARILHPMSLADQLTLIRIAAVPGVVVLFVWAFDGHYWWATAVFIAAMTTDWFDGRVARWRGRTAPLGSLLGPGAPQGLAPTTLIMLAV